MDSGPLDHRGDPASVNICPHEVSMDISSVLCYAAGFVAGGSRSKGSASMLGKLATALRRIHDAIARTRWVCRPNASYCVRD